MRFSIFGSTIRSGRACIASLAAVAGIGMGMGLYGLPSFAQTQIPTPDAAYDPTKPAPKQAEEIIKAGEQKSFIWEIKSSTNTIFLFGTIHVGKKSFYPLPPAIEDAFKRSGKLVLEADISNTEGTADIGKLIVYTPPDSLEKHIPVPLYARLKQQATRLKLPQDGIKQMKPFLVGGLLSISEFTRLGYDMNLGVEAYLIAMAKESKKPVLELESQLGQINMLNDMSPALQEAFLENAIATLEANQSADQVTGMVNAWQSGDVQLMQDVTADVTKNARMAAELDEVLLYRRHAEMLKKIEGYLADDKSYFVAVGSLHLVGPRGLIEQLKIKGYKVRQL